MLRNRLLRLAMWPVIAGTAFAVLLTALLTLGGSGANHRYVEIPELAIRVGLPPAYEYCASTEPSPAFYLICDDKKRKMELAASPQSGGQRGARYSVSIFDVEASSSLGYDPAKGINSVRDGVSGAFFVVLSGNGTQRTTDPTLQVTSVAVDGRDALEFVARGSASRVPGQQRRLLIVGLADGRLLEVFNQPYGSISAEADASNFREIVRGIKFHPS